MNGFQGEAAAPSPLTDVGFIADRSGHETDPWTRLGNSGAKTLMIAADALGFFHDAAEGILDPAII